MGDMTITPCVTRGAREARIAKLCRDHAWRFHQVCPGDEARYVVEAYVLRAGPDDWAFAYAYVAAHPELFTTMPRLSQREVRERNEDCSRQLEGRALAAVRDQNFGYALALIDDANWWSPVDWYAVKRDSIIREQAKAEAGAGD